MAGVRNILGGRSGSYEEELLRARQEALAEMEERALALGSDNGMLMVTVSGTAVVTE